MIESRDNYFSISVAGHVIAIRAIYTEVKDLCKDYLTEEDPEFQIEISQEEIDSERMIDQQQNISRRNSYLETLVVYRKICGEMLSYNSFLMHGAVIAYNDNAYMFTASSGTGKTTHIRQWLDSIDHCSVVNGDKPLIHITETQAIACGTPWCGKEKMNTNVMVPLKAIVLMERSEDNKIVEITFEQALINLLQQTYRPAEAAQMKKTLSLLSQLKDKVHFYRFNFNNYKNDAVQVAFQALVPESN